MPFEKPDAFRWLSIAGGKPLELFLEWRRPAPLFDMPDNWP